MIDILPVQETAVSGLDFDTAVESAVCEMQNVLKHAPAAIREYTSHMALSQGKFIRARCLFAAALNERNAIHPDAVKLACALELIHLASLVHDDVIDDSPLRRGIPTVQQKFGKKTAVLCGDWLLCSALGMISAIEQREAFFSRSLTDFAGKLCLGELSQQAHNTDFNLGYYRYLAIISGKTAALFEAAFFAGAVLAGENETHISSLSRAGKYLGMIFQLVDDCIDYEHEQDTAGKPVQNDFDQGVVTMPLIYALNTDSELRSKIRRLSGAEVVQAVRRAGGVFFTKKIARRYFSKAQSALNRCAFTEKKRELFSLLFESALEGPQKA